MSKSLQEIKEATKKEASQYYTEGHIYAYESEEYVFTEKCGELAHFHSFSGKHLYIPVESLGTFLPNVASEGLEIAFIE